MSLARLLVTVSPLLLCTVSCTLITDVGDECSSDQDCVPLAASGQSLICHADGYCVEGSASPECQTNEDCADNAPRTVCDANQRCVEPAESCVNSECAALGPNMICGRDNVCVSALSERCTRVQGPIDGDDVFFVGSLQAGMEFSSTGVSQENAIVMAVEEFNGRAPFFPASKRAVLIACNDRGNPDDGVIAATHLVETVGVQAIVGPGFSSTTTEVVTQVTVPNNVFTISGSATSASITGLVDNDLAWRAAASDVFQSVAIAQRIMDLHDAAGGGQLDILAFAKDDVYGRGLSEAISDLLAGESNISISTTLHGDGTQPGEAAGAVPVGLSNVPDPDIVLLLGTSEVFEVFEALENEDIEPQYLVSDGGKLEDLTMAVQTRMESDPGLRLRIEGTAPNTENDTDSLFDSYASRYRTKYQDEPVRFSANAYDATYLVLFARIAVDAAGEEWTGPNIAEVFQTRYTDDTGGVVTAKPSDIQSGRDILSGGSNFDFVGASGPLDFDPATGEAPGNVDRWIILSDFTFENCGIYRPDDAEWDIPANDRCE